MDFYHFADENAAIEKDLKILEPMIHWPNQLVPFVGGWYPSHCHAKPGASRFKTFMPLANRGDLERYLFLSSPSSQELLALAKQVAEQVAHCHDSHLCHRDIKPKNILIHEQEDQLQAILIDFGVATNDMVYQVVGAPPYIDPPASEAAAKACFRP